MPLGRAISVGRVLAKAGILPQGILGALQVSRVALCFPCSIIRLVVSTCVRDIGADGGAKPWATNTSTIESE